MKPQTTSRNLVQQMLKKSMAVGTAGVMAMAMGWSTTAWAKGGGDKQEQSQMETMPSEQQAQMGGDKLSPTDRQDIQKVFGSDAEVVSLNELDEEKIKSVQQELKDMGFYQGEVDGKLGPRTKSALNKFSDRQASLTRKLIDNNQLTSVTLEHLGLDRSELQEVVGEESPGAVSPEGQQGQDIQIEPAEPQPGQEMEQIEPMPDPMQQEPVEPTPGTDAPMQEPVPPQQQDEGMFEYGEEPQPQR